MDTRKQIAARLLASGLTEAEVTRQLGIGKATLWRWMQDPEFQQLIQHETEKTLEQLHENLAKLDAYLLNAIIKSVNRLENLAQTAYEKMKNETPELQPRWALVAINAEKALSAVALKRLNTITERQPTENLGDLIANLQLSTLDEGDVNAE